MLARSANETKMIHNQRECGSERDKQQPTLKKARSLSHFLFGSSVFRERQTSMLPVSVDAHTPERTQCRMLLFAEKPLTIS